ncbi:MAG: hypothetical protein KF838_12270 [Phycisphaeraceae bacterium]|nr:MAG: hypothetical protein KF838_12270 [Phycisphaeraceae bacterium]
MNTIPPASDAHPSRSTERASTLLVLTAIALAFCCGLRLIGLAGSPASAEMVTTIQGDMVALTADSGSEDALLVLDNRTERIMVYRLTAKGLELFASESLRELFARARASSPG